MLINDLVTENARLRKYVDDTKASIISETVAKGELSNTQRITDRVIKRSPQNRVQLNDRCEKKMRYYLSQSASKNLSPFSLMSMLYT